MVHVQPPSPSGHLVNAITGGLINITCERTRGEVIASPRGAWRCPCCRARFDLDDPANAAPIAELLAFKARPARTSTGAFRRESEVR